MDFIFIHIPKCGGTSVRKSLGIERIGHTPIERVDYENNFTFSFVRNPFERLQSFYRYLRRDDIRDIASDKLTFKQWFYLTLVKQKHYYYYQPEFWNPCFNWLSVDGELKVDWVGRVEYMQEDWRRLCEKLNKNVILETHNSTNKEEFKFTEEMKEIVLDKYKKDFELWYPNLI